MELKFVGIFWVGIFLFKDQNFRIDGFQVLYVVEGGEGIEIFCGEKFFKWFYEYGIFVQVDIKNFVIFVKFEWFYCQ